MTAESRYQVYWDAKVKRAGYMRDRDDEIWPGCMVVGRWLTEADARELVAQLNHGKAKA